MFDTFRNILETLVDPDQRRLYCFVYTFGNIMEALIDPTTERFYCMFVCIWHDLSPQEDIYGQAFEVSHRLPIIPFCGYWPELQLGTRLATFMGALAFPNGSPIAKLLKSLQSHKQS